MADQFRHLGSLRDFLSPAVLSRTIQIIILFKKLKNLRFVQFISTIFLKIINRKNSFDQIHKKYSSIKLPNVSSQKLEIWSKKNFLVGKLRKIRFSSRKMKIRSKRIFESENENMIKKWFSSRKRVGKMILYNFH